MMMTLYHRGLGGAMQRDMLWVRQTRLTPVLCLVLDILELPCFSAGLRVHRPSYRAKEMLCVNFQGWAGHSTQRKLFPR